MGWNLPPLNALRAFEATARLGSFTLAAEELGMTQSGVSYQIKILEERAHSPLFVRKPREIALTEVGKRLAPEATMAMARLAEAWLSLREEQSGVLSITSVPSFASNWLAVHLGGFQLLHPKLAVKVDTASRLIDFDQEDVDIGIRTGSGDWPDVAKDYLFGADLTPMISPTLAEQVGGIHVPEDLYKVPWCGAENPGWSSWFSSVGVELDPKRIIRGPSLSMQVYDAIGAITDQGAAILTEHLYRPFIARGQLIQPFKAISGSEKAYWVVTSKNKAAVPRKKLMRDWLLKSTAEIRKSEQKL